MSARHTILASFVPEIIKVGGDLMKIILHGFSSKTIY